jgi:biopolymer transport protein ExbD
MPCPPCAAQAENAKPGLPLDLPKAEDWGGQIIFVVDVAPNGDMVTNGKPVTSDDDLRERARQAIQGYPELRAVIRADPSVSHGRVIRVLDLLKQSGISKIAFGVAPSSGPTAPAPAGRLAGVTAGTSWECAFPDDKHAKGIDSAMVVIEVDVDAAGRPISVRILADPGYGFGDAATACAMSRTYIPAFNAEGKAVTGKTPPIRIRFVR